MAALRTPAVKAWQLKYWAFLTGIPTTGTKAELQQLLTNRLDQPARTERPTKIVSVDMGIRNLAYCAIEAPALDMETTSNGTKKMDDPRKRLEKQSIEVKAWRRMDLTTSGMSQEAPSQEGKNPDSTGSNSIPSNDIFTPSNLSRTALKVTEELLSHSPTTILIERQRFRSGGSAAIQEWTVRVNMLESMIWACLETFRSNRNTSRKTPFPSIHAVNPATVVNFWSTPASISLLPPTLFTPENTSVQHMISTALGTRTKMEKKDKVELVRKWCRALDSDSDVPLKFNDETWKVAAAFTTSSRQTKRVKELVGGKLDDMADCLLQGVTWVRWERNRRVLGEMWRRACEEEAGKDGEDEFSRPYA